MNSYPGLIRKEVNEILIIILEHIIAGQRNLIYIKNGGSLINLKISQTEIQLFQLKLISKESNQFPIKIVYNKKLHLLTT